MLQWNGIEQKGENIMVKVADKELNLINAGSRYKVGKGYSESLGLVGYRKACDFLVKNFAYEPYEEVMSSIPEYNTVSKRFLSLFAEVEDGLVIGCKPYDFKKMCSLLSECQKNPHSRR